MSGAQTSTFTDPNILYKTLSGAGMQEVEQNRLLNVERQQDIAANNTEVVARAASTLLDPTLYPTEEARAAAWPGVIKQLKASGYAPNAPDYYPGEQHLRLTARLGTPSAELYKLGVDRTAKGAIAPGDGGTAATGGTGGGGGGTGTVGGADTAPINAAGDSRTRKAAEGGPPAAGSPGAAVAKQVHDFWISKGFSEEQTAGILAGGPGSESDFTPTVFGDNGTSYGLYQHHGPRLDAMRQFFGLSSSQNPTADQQNQYAYWEITQGPLKNVGEMLKAAKTPAEAAAIWTQYFGVPADKSEIGRRARGADRFMVYAGQPGAPRASTAPGVVMGDVGRPGDVPSPPGGAPGAYPAYGGGMGAVIGGQPAAARATIPAGRPTGPPVVTDQPAGGGVVAGPPGTAVVGAPQPPSPEVPGNVAAINAGIVGAGGQPATDPNLTPTPARYAGTAPAPSVEALPQSGWGTGIGSGYGPQNALAPAPVPPAPARPAVPAAGQPGAAQPPAADTLPPLPAPTPPAPTNRNGLTPAQQQDINKRRGMPNVSADELQKRVDAYVGANAAAAEKYQQDQIAYVREARERQSAAETRRHTGVEEARQAVAEKLAQEKAAREAADAAKLQLSKSDEADAIRVLQAIGPKVRAGADLTEEEKDQYDIARRRYARGPLQQVPDGKGGTITAFVGQEVPDRFPPLPGQKEYAGLKPIPGTEKQPDFAPATAMTSMLDIGEGQRKILRALDSLNKYPGGVGLVAGSQPTAMSNWTDPAGVNVRADVGDVKAHIYHTLSGSAVTAIEEPRLQRFSPQETDTAVALKTKLQRMLDLNRETQLDHYRAFGPEAGGRRNPAVEDSILATIPQAALDHLKENPTTTKDFDKMYGRGAAKLALQNG